MLYEVITRAGLERREVIVARGRSQPGEDRTRIRVLHVCAQAFIHGGVADLGVHTQLTGSLNRLGDLHLPGETVA